MGWVGQQWHPDVNYQTEVEPKPKTKVDHHTESGDKTPVPKKVSFGESIEESTSSGSPIGSGVFSPPEWLICTPGY